MEGLHGLLYILGELSGLLSKPISCICQIIINSGLLL